jgi:deazaflavin-dependent oxidoreductase (nitroreductase family)
VVTDTRKTRSGPPRWLAKAFEPLATLVAGRRWFPLWAVVHHVGRRSGKTYAVPIAVIPTRSNDIVMIGLPWGTRTNWVQNVLAAGGATLTWKGGEHVVTNPRIVDTHEAVALAKGPVRRVVSSGRFPAFLLLDR